MHAKIEYLKSSFKIRGIITAYVDGKWLGYRVTRFKGTILLPSFLLDWATLNIGASYRESVYDSEVFVLETKPWNAQTKRGYFLFAIYGGKNEMICNTVNQYHVLLKAGLMISCFCWLMLLHPKYLFISLTLKIFIMVPAVVAIRQTPGF